MLRPHDVHEVIEMSESPEFKSELVALSARIRELESHLIRGPLGRANDGDTNGCTNCNTNGCTNCSGDRFSNVLLPGEEVRLSGSELVSRLKATRHQG